MEMFSFWLVILALVLFIGYALLIGYYKKGWIQSPDFEASGQFIPQKKVSVIISARNEESTISSCLASLREQTYPAALLEIIVVDDHSNDKTAEIVKAFTQENIRLISLAEQLNIEINSYKKKAIETGISASTGEWIITTDADCVAGPYWITAMMEFQEMNGAQLIAGPVRLMSRKNLLDVFQTLDFITLQGITAASVYKKFHAMCNGANLGYSKKAFVQVNGFENIDAIASGDDMLLMQKIQKQFPEKIFYIKSRQSIVSSLPAKNWKDFWQQRIRWASKTSQYDDTKIFLALLLVYLFNFCLLSLFVLSFWNVDAFLIAVLLLTCKIIIEFPFVKSVASFFEQEKLMVYFPFLQPLHLIYIVLTGLLGKFGRYEWKGRKVK